MSVSLQDPNYLTFKPNELSSCLGLITSNSKEEHNPFSFNSTEIKDSSLSKQVSTQPKAISSLISNQLLHNSFLKVTLHLLYNISSYKKFLFSKAFNPNDLNSKLLCELKAVFNRYETRKEFFVDHLHYILSKLFKEQNKFSMIEPDNPIDCYFIMINSLHNYSIHLDLNNITTQQCYSCFSHSNFYMDISRKEYCVCGWNKVQSLSSLNYIMNIPIDNIFKLVQNSNLIEMNKTFKFKAINFCSEVKDMNKTNDRDSSIGKISGKLFFYLCHLVNDDSQRALCEKCSKNYIIKSLLMNNLPDCLSFSFSNKNLFSFDLNEMLLSYILIPKIFELGQLFDTSSQNKIFYDFCGILMIKKTMTYSVATKSLDTTWKYVYQNSVVYCKSWFELISLCLKEMSIPILVLYQIQEKFSNKEKDLDCGDIRSLERYVRCIEGLRLDNPFRVSEGVIQIGEILTQMKEQKLSETNNSNVNKNHSSKTSTCNSTTSRTSSIVKGDEMNKYNCLYCGLRNRIENVQCLSCMKNNRDVINKIKYSKQDDSFFKNERGEIFKQKYFCNKKDNTNSYNQQIQLGLGLFKEQVNKSKDQSSFNSINRKPYSKKENTPVIINQQVYDKTSAISSREISQDNQKKQRKREKLKGTKSIRSAINTFDKWKCDICENYNQANAYRCFSCRTMNTFQRDLLQGNKCKNEKSQNPQYRNKQAIKTNKSQLYSQTESLQNIQLNTRQLSFENISPENEYYNNISKKKYASIISNKATPTMLFRPNKRNSIFFSEKY